MAKNDKLRQKYRILAQFGPKLPILRPKNITKFRFFSNFLIKNLKIWEINRKENANWDSFLLFFDDKSPI